MPELLKPDMPAVLARTNLARHLGGFLLPIFEAVSNSIHSIFEEHGGGSSASDGRIAITVKDTIDLDDFEVSVVDNGSGLDRANLTAFLTPFTGNKLRKNGKGFGRFIGFKVFKNIEYDSKTSDEEVTYRFRFDIYEDEELIRLRGHRNFPHRHGCKVVYSDIKPEYANSWRRLDEKAFLDQITQNFLTYSRRWYDAADRSRFQRQDDRPQKSFSVSV